MKVRLITVGKPRQKGLSAAAETYAGRLSRYVTFDELPLREERAGKGVSETEVIRKEGDRILSALRPNVFTVALDRLGKSLSSETLAREIGGLRDTGRDVDVVIGGAFGLSPGVLNAAHLSWSLSEATLPHELARVVVLEQLYRAYTILNGEPYHK